MAKEFTMKNYNGTGYDILHPKTSMGQVEGLNTKMSEVEAIARGASRAKVFDTVAELDAWLAVAANKATLQLGDNFYIRATDVPDYWWDGTDKKPLEAEKVVLSNASSSQDGLTSKADKSKLDGVATNATSNAASATAPKMNSGSSGTVGTESGFSRGDHIHPVDTSREAAFTKNSAFNKVFETNAGNIKAPGTAAAGTSENIPRADHVHPAQTSVSGNAGTATKLAAVKTFELKGDVTGSIGSDLSGTVSIPATMVANKSNQKVAVSKNSTTAAGTRKQINFKDGSNVTVNVADNATNDSVDVTISSTNTTYSDATTSASGLMGAADKTKLNGVAEGAEVNVITAIQKNGTAITPSGKTINIALAKGDVGLGSVDNTADSAKNVASAAKLTSAKTIALTGAVVGSVSSDLSSGASITTSLSVPVVTAGTTAPASPKAGDIWFDYNNN